MTPTVEQTSRHAYGPGTPSGTRKTVVHFIESDTFGGCEEVVKLLLVGLKNQQCQPVLFHHGAPSLSRLIDELAAERVRCVAVPRITKRNVATTLRQFGRELNALRASVFHVHLNWPLACKNALVAANLFRIPGIVATSHLGSPLTDARFGWLKRSIHDALIDRYVAVSVEVKKGLCQRLGVSASKVRVVYNGISLAPFGQPADSQLRASLAPDGGGPIIFTPARLHTQKGHVDLLHAAASIPNARFVLAGDGPEREALESLARALGIQDRVWFLGQRQDVPRLLASCDLFVLPSLYEGLPVSVLEAMAAGKPVIATAVGGTDEAVVHGTTGLLVPPRNPPALSEAIRTLLADHGLASRLAQAGKVRVAKLFSCDAMARGVANLYDELDSEQIERVAAS